MSNKVKKGTSFVFAGIDSSGKKTYSNWASEWLKEEKQEVMLIDFPRYNKPTSALVNEYLIKESFGKDASKIDPKYASAIYAIDRFGSYLFEFFDFYNNGGIIFFDRYATANAIHQAGKIKDLEKRDELLEWLNHLEYEVFGIPKPDKIFFFDMPVEHALNFMKERATKGDGTMKKDLHEKDPQHLYDAREAGLYVAKKFNWEIIKCTDENNKLIPMEEIFSIVKEKINEVLIEREQ